MRAFMYVVAFLVMALGAALSILSGLGRLPPALAEHQGMLAGIAVSILAGLVFVGLGAAIGRGKSEIDRASRDTVVRPTRRTEPVSLKPPSEAEAEKPQEDDSEDKASDEDDFFLIDPLDQ
jgi:hypothetical protein